MLLRADWGFHWEAPSGVLERWQPELDRITPHHSANTDRLTHLRLVWVPGDPWAPVERWFVYQCWPLASFDWSLYGPDLVGANPRTLGSWDYRHGRYLPPRNCTIDRMQWVLFRETGGYLCRPYFVVQGRNGGHLRRYTRVEELLMATRGEQFTSPPAPGDLPYAEPDARTIRYLADEDRFRKYRVLAAAFEERHLSGALDREDEEVMRAVRADVSKWMEREIDNALEAEAWGAERAFRALADADIPTTDVDPQQRLEWHEQEMVEGGHLLPVSV